MNTSIYWAVISLFLFMIMVAIAKRDRYGEYDLIQGCLTLGWLIWTFVVGGFLLYQSL